MPLLQPPLHTQISNNVVLDACVDAKAISTTPRIITARRCYHNINDYRRKHYNRETGCHEHVITYKWPLKYTRQPEERAVSEASPKE